MRRGKVRQSAKFPGTIPGILTSPAALVYLVPDRPTYRRSCWQLRAATRSFVTIPAQDAITQHKSSTKMDEMVLVWMLRPLSLTSCKGLNPGGLARCAQPTARFARLSDRPTKHTFQLRLMNAIAIGARSDRHRSFWGRERGRATQASQIGNKTPLFAAPSLPPKRKRGETLD